MAFVALGRETSRIVERVGQDLRRFEELTKTADPKVQLKRGFTLVKRPDGSYITTGAQAEVSDKISIEFHDRAREAVITK